MSSSRETPCMSATFHRRKGRDLTSYKTWCEWRNTLRLPRPIEELILRRLLSGFGAGLWYPSSQVQTRPKPSDFSGRKNPQHASFGGEVKPSVPCCRFTACKRFLNATWKSGISGKTHRPFLAHIVPPLATRISGETTSGESWNV